MSAAAWRRWPARVAIVLVGSAVSSYGYLMTERAAVGNGPLFALQDALHLRTGVSLGVAAAVAGLAFAVLARGLGVRLGVGPIAIPLLTGVSIAVLEPLAPELHGAALRWGSFTAGTVVMMLGGVVMFRGGIGGSSLEAAMFGIAHLARTTPARARIGLEVAMAVAGFALGGRVGLGTAAMAVSVGPLFAFWHRVLPEFAGHGAADPAGSIRRDAARDTHPASSAGATDRADQSVRRRAFAISRAASRSD